MWRPGNGDQLYVSKPHIRRCVSMTDRQTAKIRELNDTLRTQGPSDLGRWVTTPGILGMGGEFTEAAFDAVRAFDQFTKDNDPYGEHDYGSFDLSGNRVIWKIDYYDRGLIYGSENPADPEVTCRVLTVCFASEY